MTIQAVETRTQARHGLHQHPEEPAVISGEKLRRALGLSSRRFYALVKSGRLDHLRAINLCTHNRTFYVRSLALAWATEQPQLTLRAGRNTRPSLQSHSGAVTHGR